MLGQILGSEAGLLMVLLAAVFTHYLLRGGGGSAPMGRGMMPGGMGGGKQAKARAHTWSLRLTVILMFLGAILMTVTGLGNFIHSVIMFPLAHVGAAAVTGTVLFAIALLEVVHGLIKRPGKTTVTAAFFLAFTLTLPLASFAGKMAAQMLATGNSYAAQVSAAMMGTAAQPGPPAHARPSVHHRQQSPGF